MKNCAVEHGGNVILVAGLRIAIQIAISVKDLR